MSQSLYRGLAAVLVAAETLAWVFLVAISIILRQSDLIGGSLALVFATVATVLIALFTLPAGILVIKGKLSWLALLLAVFPLSVGVFFM